MLNSNLIVEILLMRTNLLSKGSDLKIIIFFKFQKMFWNQFGDFIDLDQDPDSINPVHITAKNEKRTLL